MAVSPITTVSVTPPNTTSTSTTAYLEVTYQIGGTSVATNFNAKKIGDKWLLEDTVLEINLDNYLNGKDLDLTLNGVAVGEIDTALVFPGEYTIATTNPMYELEKATFMLTKRYDSPSSPQVKLSAEGAAKVQTAVNAAIDQCLTIASLEPENCGFGIRAPENEAIVESSIVWSRAADAADITTIEPELSYTDLANVTMYLSPIRLEITVQTTDGGTMSGYGSIFKAVANISDPNNITVVFD